jgi:hypothetical protein
LTAPAHQQDPAPDPRIEPLERTVEILVAKLESEHHTLQMLVAELGSLRLALSAHGISAPPMLMVDDGWRTIQQFARENGLSVEAVRSRSRRGRLEYQRRGTRIFVRWPK